MQNYIPTQKEKDKVSSIVSELSNKIKQKDIILEIGGSIAKDTWLPDTSDMDFFLKFDYSKYKDKSSQLSDIAEPLLTKVFAKLKRVHGSRDYFQFKYKGYDIEVVPVLNIEKPEQARNITDHSPLHVLWLKKQIQNNKNLPTEIRKAKRFFKSQNIYGAESYLRGFSGHVTEILTSYYGCFEELLQASIKWKQEQVIDAANHYETTAQAIKAINESKISPLIVIDPVEKNRNAAAALSIEKFKQLKKIAEQYLKKPSDSFFAEKVITLSQLKKKKQSRKLLYFELQPSEGKRDVVGAKLFKQFSEAKSTLIENDFNILESNWFWQGKGKALCWFYLPKKELTRTKIHWGPTITAHKENIIAFKNKWKTTKIKNKKYYTIIKRTHTKPEQIIKLAKAY